MEDKFPVIPMELGNNGRLKEMINVMKAFYEGQKIQMRSSYSPWQDCRDPQFNWVNFDYRIKPASKVMPYTNIQDLCSAIQEYGRTITKGVDDAKYCINSANISFEDILSLSVTASCNDHEYTFSALDLAKEFYFSFNEQPCGKIVE